MSLPLNNLLAVVAREFGGEKKWNIKSNHYFKIVRIVVLITVFGVLFAGNGFGQCGDAGNFLGGAGQSGTVNFSSCSFDDDNSFGDCGLSGPDDVWTFTVPAGTTITVQQTSNTYDSYHMLRYGAACGSTTFILCVDDPDTQVNTWTNTTGADQTVWWWIGGFSNACGDGTFTWSITGLCSGTPNAGTAAITSTSGCTGQSFTLSATGLSTGGGLTYQWQSAPTASGAWTNIAGGTTASFATSTSTVGQTFYRLVSTCAGVSSNSNVVSYTAASCAVVPTTGVSYITSCSTTIYDAGGVSGNYALNTSGTIIIRPTSMDQVITVTGTYATENGFDYLSLDEGEDSNPNTSIIDYTGSGTITPYTTSGPGIPLVIHLTSDGLNNSSGFALTISCACAKPTAITLTTTNAPCGGTGSVTVNTVTAPDQKPWVMATFENDALPTLPWLPTAAPNAWFSGNAAHLTGNNNQMRLTQAVNSQNGALVFQSYGENQAELLGYFDIWIDDNNGFDGSADGLSFSYGPNIATTPVATNGGYESGVGQGVIISFDTYNSGAGVFPNCNGTNFQSIYLLYNNTVLACQSNFDNTFFRGSQNLCSVYISPTGRLFLTVNVNGVDTDVFPGGVQLPASYLTDNKSSWKAALAARTGGVNDRHRVDNINLYHFYDYEFSINGTSWQASPTFAGLASGTYTMYVRLKGLTCSFTQTFTITAPIASTAPTTITGTTSACLGGSTTLTVSGGTLGTDAEYVWYEGSCPTDCYTQEWLTQPFVTSGTTQNSLVNGILNVTSTSVDPIIDMSGLGSFDPATCRYVNIRYRVISGTAGNTEIFFYNTANPSAVGGQTGFGTLISDNTWRTVSVDMWQDPEYQTGGNITGFRFDWATALGVNMEIDYITLSNLPILSSGAAVNVSPTVPTTYFTLIRGLCNTTSCVSQLVTIVQPPTTATVGTAQSICGLTSTALGGNTPAIGTGAWSIVSGGTGTFSDAASPSSTFTATASGVYVLRWTISNTPCTPSTADITVTFFQNPSAASVGSNQTICSSLISTALGGNTPAIGTGQWSIFSGGGGTFSDINSPSSTFTATATGTYVLRWTISNGTCTPTTADITVIFGATPTPGITGTTSFCSGSSTTLTASGGGTYAWSNSLGSSATTSAITAANTYTVTVTSTEGCTATASQAVTMTALPSVPTITNNSPVCSGSNAVFTLTGTAGLSVAYSNVTGTPISPVTIGPGGTATVTVNNATANQTLTLVSVSDASCTASPGTTNTITVTTCAVINECDILVYEIGTGAAAATAAPVTILQFQSNFTNTSTPTRLTIPVSGITNNLTNASGLTGGDANSILTGYMNTSNGILAIPGYSDASGTTNIWSGSENERVNLMNAAQTTTVVNNTGVFTGNPSYIRGVVAVDATRFYCFGAGTTLPTSGIFYWNGTAFTQIFTDAGCVQGQVTNIRNIDIVNGQLYMLRKSGTTAPVNILFAVGNGLPTLLTTTATLVTNYGTTTANSPISFSISPDGSTMYTTDNSSFGANGITKWIKTTNGGVFNRVVTANYTANATNNTTPGGVGNGGSASANKYLGIAVDWNASPVKIYATSSTLNNTGGAFLVALTESAGIGVNAATWATVGNVQYYAANTNCTGCKYTGVDLAPSISASFTAGVNTTVSPFTACVNNPISVTASALQTTVNNALTYQWYKYTSSAAYVDYFGATVVTGADGTGGTTATFTPIVAGNYFCEINGGSCAKYRTPPVIVSSTLPTVSATVGTCSGSTADVTVTASGATAGYNISWSGFASGNPVGTEITSSGGTYPITGLSSGSYTITALSANGCSASTTATVSCGGCTNPTIDTQPTDITECLNASQQLAVTASGATLTYQWYSNTSASNTGGTLLTGETNATYTPPSGSAGTFYYYVIVNSSTCATTSNAVTVVVNANNTAGSASANPIVCVGTAIAPSITINTTGATGIGTPTGLPTGVTAAWLGDVITISGTPSTVVGSPFSYSIPLSGGCGSVNATGTITVNPNPTAGITGSTTYCTGGTTSLTATGGGTYNWSNSLGTNAIVSVGSAGSYTVTVTLNGCTAESSVTVVVNNCNNFGEFASAVYVETCNTNVQTNNYYNTTGSVVNQISATAYQSTNFGSYFQNSGQLKLQGGEMKTWKSNPGNVCGVTLYYRVYPSLSAPSGAFSAITLPFYENCGGSSFATGGPCNGSDQKWQRPGNANPLANIDLTTYAPDTYALEVYYDIQGSHTNINNCDAIVSVNNSGANFISNFTIVAPPTASNTGAYCPGQTIQLNASNGGTAYSWSGPNTYTNSTQTPTITTATTAMAGTYTVSVSLANNCTTTAQTLVVVNPTPTVSLNCPALCAGIATDITATPSPTGTYTYNWTVLPGGVTNPGNSAIVNTSTAGTYTVIATNATTNCPSVATSCTIAVQNQPSINAISPP